MFMNEKQLVHTAKNDNTYNDNNNIVIYNITNDQVDVSV